MKIRSLNQRGFSHDLLIVLVVAVTAIVGVGYMVGSNANSKCTAKQIAQGKCKKATSGPVSSSMSGAGAMIASCTIKGLPNNPRHNQSVNPSIYIYNYGRTTIKPSVDVRIYSYGNDARLTYQKTVKVKKLKPNHSYKIKLPKYKVAYRTNAVTNYSYTANAVGMNCQKSLVLPFVPANKQ